MENLLQEINPVPADRLREIMRENKTEKGTPYKAIDLCRAAGISQKHISNIMTLNKPLSRSTAEKIVKAFPQRHYRPEWLLGADDFKTEGELFRFGLQKLQNDMREATANQRIIAESVAALLRLYGVEWDGKPTPRRYHKDETGTHRLPDLPAAEYLGTPLYSWELSRIANKVFDFIGMELNSYVRAKFEIMDFYKDQERLV